jgi:hypothetical protein
VAVVPVNITPIPNPGNPLGWLVQWANMQAGDTGAPLFDLWQFADRSIQVEGVFGGASGVLNGSNDGVNQRVLSDPQGLPLSFTAGAIKAISECSGTVQPAVIGGDGTTSLTFTIVMRRTV